MFDLIQLDQSLMDLLVSKSKLNKDLPVGVDGLTQQKFVKFKEFHLKEIHRGLQKSVSSKYEYTFGVLYQLARVKKSGGYRYLYVPRIRDQIVFKAMLDAIKMQLEKSLRLTSISPRNAVIQFHSFVAKFNDPWILRTDISDYYNSIDRGILLSELKEVEGLKPELLTLLKSWFSNINYRDAVTNKVKSMKTGLPQGVSLSSILAEFYLTSIDKQIGGGYFRYVDDIILVAENRNQASMALRRLNALMDDKNLHLSKPKTKIAPLAAGVEWVGLVHYPKKIRASELKYLEWRKGLIRVLKKVRSEFPKSSICWEDSSQMKSVILSTVNDFIRGENNRRLLWFQLIEDEGQWNELDAFVHGQIKFLFKFYGLQILEDDRLPSIKLYLSRIKRMKPPIAD